MIDSSLKANKVVGYGSRDYRDEKQVRNGRKCVADHECSDAIVPV